MRSNHRLSPQSVQAISQYAGLSELSVADHLRGRRPLPDRASGRIEAAIRDLGLDVERRSKEPTPTVGLLIPSLVSPFFAELAAAVERAAIDRGWALVLLPTGDAVSREIEHIDRLKRGELQGLLLATNNGADRALARSIDDGDRVVLINEEVRGRDLSLVSYDNRASGALVGQFLVERGHRRFCYVAGPKDASSAVQRGNGLRTAVRNVLGRQADIRFCFGSYREEHGYDTVRRMAKAGTLPEALVAGSDSIAIGAIRALRELSVEIPRSLSLASIDGTNSLALARPRVVSIRVPAAELAERAMDVLLRRPSRSARPIRVTLPVQLVGGESVRDVDTVATDVSDRAIA